MFCKLEQGEKNFASKWFTVKKFHISFQKRYNLPFFKKISKKNEIS